MPLGNEGDRAGAVALTAASLRLHSHHGEDGLVARRGGGDSPRLTGPSRSGQSEAPVQNPARSYKTDPFCTPRMREGTAPATHCDERDRRAVERRLVRRLEALGNDVPINCRDPAA